MDTDLLLQQVVVAVIGLCVTILTGLATYGIKKLDVYLESKIGKESYEAFQLVVQNIVHALEQQGGFFSWDGQKKKELATVLVARAIEKANLNIPKEYIDIAIEATVQQMNELKLPEDAG